MAAKEIEVSTQPNIKVNLENHEATHYTCTEEKKQQNGHWSTAATPRPFLVLSEPRAVTVQQLSFLIKQNFNFKGVLPFNHILCL